MGVTHEKLIDGSLRETSASEPRPRALLAVARASPLSVPQRTPDDLATRAARLAPHAMARSETSPLLHGVRRGIDSHVVDLDGPSGESKVFGASKKTRAWMLAGVTAVVGTVAVAGVGVEGMLSLIHI